ncbi:MAG TPA: Ig-like domain-containing protein [Myxococcaceae bacterium]|nr:Ig-like domain-containing protein [Myxococcaceae bacterium]
MRRLRIVALVGLSALVACKEPIPPLPRTWPLTVTFVAPSDGEVDVPTSSRVWIRATETLSDEKVHASISLATDTGEVVAYDVKLSEDQLAAVLSPTSPLQPGRSYQVVFLRDAAHTADQVLSHFDTRPSATRSQDGFQAVSFLPMDAPGMSVWPFTTFRVLLSEPVREDSVFGGVRLVRDSTGEAVAAEVLVHGRTIALDPVDDLVPGERYRLELTSDLVDLAGEHLTLTTMELPPVRTVAPMKQLSLAMGPTPVEGGTAPIGSRLESVAPNTLEMKSSLTGGHTLTMGGALNAVLPDPGQIGQRLPMVIRKGQVLTVTGPDNGGLEIRLGGAIDTTLNSGALSMTLLTDASGEISENPLRPDAPGARPLVRLAMDAALTAEDNTVNTMLTQNLLGLQLVGSIYVQEGRLGVELVGGVELELLGLETAASWVTIGAWSADKVTPVPPPPMTVRLMGPANNEEGIDLDRPIQVVFSQPPDASARDSVWLERFPGDGIRGSPDDVPTSVVTQGAMALLRSRTPLDVGAQYTVRVAAGVKSVTGAVLQSRWASSFTTRKIDPTSPRPTLVGSLRPGMPCAFSVDGGVTTDQCSATSPSLGQIALASDLPVEAHFSKPVDPTSLRLGDTVQVRDVTAGAPVQGRLKTGVDWLQFIPDAPWQEGRAYSLRLGGPSDGGCGSICDTAGQAVNTDVLLNDTPEIAGGPPIVLPFVGASPSGQGGLTLRLRPASDTNANAIIDADEVARPENSVTMRNPDGGAVLDRTYLSGTLLSEVGRYNPATAELPLIIDQGSWLYGTGAQPFGFITDRLIIQPASQQIGVVRAPGALDPDRRPILNLPMTAFMHSADVQTESALQRAPLLLTLEGRLSFTPDGRMEAVMTNTNVVTLGLAQGALPVLISPGDVQVRASSGVLGR